MKIVNVREFGGIAAAQRAGVVYCGRPSVLGNPFVVGKHGTRDEVIEKFRQWLWNRLQANDKAVLKAMNELNEESVLGCWCTPSACHCEVIQSAWKWLQGTK